MVYAQPDLVDRDTTDVLPNDPYFGPSAFANKDGCSGSSTGAIDPYGYAVIGRG